MEHIFLVDPIGKLPEKPVCLKRLSSLTGWDVSTGLLRSIHILLGFPSSSRPFTIYFRFFSDLMGNVKYVLRTGFSERDFPIEIFCVPFAQFETRWVFNVNGKQPWCPGLIMWVGNGTDHFSPQQVDSSIFSSRRRNSWHNNSVQVVVLVILEVQNKLNTCSYSKLTCHAFVPTDDNRHGIEQAVTISCDITRYPRR